MFGNLSLTSMFSLEGYQSVSHHSGELLAHSSTPLLQFIDVSGRSYCLSSRWIKSPQRLGSSTCVLKITGYWNTSRATGGCTSQQNYLTAEWGKRYASDTRCLVLFLCVPIARVLIQTVFIPVLVISAISLLLFAWCRPIMWLFWNTNIFSTTTRYGYWRIEKLLTASVRIEDCSKLKHIIPCSNYLLEWS